MTQCKHPNIVTLYFICQNPYAIIMEYMSNGSLADFLEKQKNPLPLARSFDIAIDIAKGLAYLHSKNFIHCDLKSLNVAVDKNYRAKLIDFGSVISVGEKSFGLLPRQWTAPELLNAPGDNTYATDIYNYGGILWELVFLKKPNKIFNDVYQIDQIIIPENNELKDWEDMITQALATDANDRPTAQTTVIWLEKRKNEISSSNNLKAPTEVAPLSTLFKKNEDELPKIPEKNETIQTQQKSFFK